MAEILIVGTVLALAVGLPSGLWWLKRRAHERELTASFQEFLKLKDREAGLRFRHLTYATVREATLSKIIVDWRQKAFFAPYLLPLMGNGVGRGDAMRRNSRGGRRLDQVLAVTGAAVAGGALAGVKFASGWAQFLVICLLAAGTGLGSYAGNSLRARAVGTPPQVQISHPPNRVGARLWLICTMLPAGDEWRIEEMMNHRNELRAERGRVPLFHYARLFLSALEIRWEARVYPERRVD